MKRSPLDILSYPRGVIVTTLGALHTLVMCFVTLFLALVIKQSKIVDWAINYLWCMPLMWLSGVRVDVRGAEYVRKDGKGFLVLFNHSSLFDILVLFGHFPRQLRFGAKVELFKIPFFGRAMAACGMLPIDRASRSKVMKVYDHAISRVEAGECFALAPEGTRQDNVQLGKFKRGPFEFAINAKMDIVPVVLSGVLNVLPKHAIFANMGRWRRTVIMHISPPVPGSEYTMETIDNLQNLVRGQMEQVFIANTQELKGL